MAIFLQSHWDNQYLLLYVLYSLQGFSGNLAQSLGKDATLSNVLQILDEHYGVLMMFDILSKELYSLKQGLGENVVEFRMHLLQQIQTIQLEYPGRTQPEHVGEMKYGLF